MTRIKTLLVLSQPTQSTEPLELLAADDSIDLTVAYLSGVDARLWQGEEFINKQSLNLSLPTSVKTISFKNISPFPSLASRFGLVHPALLTEGWKYHCIIIYGHAYFSMWLALVGAKLAGKTVLLSNDATELPMHSQLKRWLKKHLYRLLYNKLANAVLVPSSRSRRFLSSIAIKDENIFLTPYVVDNARISTLAATRNKLSEREVLGIPLDTKVILFVGKLIARKRPLDLLRAFNRAAISNATLVYVGNGPLLEQLRSEVARLGLEKAVLIIGELCYERLIGAYVAADLLVHPADHEPWGLIVNEAMLCGLPVVTSDRVGSSSDLIEQGVSGYTYPVGDVEKLADILSRVLANDTHRAQLGAQALTRIRHWSPHENARAHREAITHLLS